MAAKAELQMMYRSVAFRMLAQLQASLIPLVRARAKNCAAAKAREEILSTLQKSLVAHVVAAVRQEGSSSLSAVLTYGNERQEAVQHIQRIARARAARRCVEFPVPCCSKDCPCDPLDPLPQAHCRF